MDAPRVVAVVDRRQRRDGVDHQQGRVAGLVDRLAHLGDAACAAGRGLVVDDADRLDRVRLVTCQVFADGGRVGAAAPVAGTEQIGRASCRERVCQYV